MARRDSVNLRKSKATRVGFERWRDLRTLSRTYFFVGVAAGMISPLWHFPVTLLLPIRPPALSTAFTGKAIF